jgi:hypothetical protein
MLWCLLLLCHRREGVLAAVWAPHDLWLGSSMMHLTKSDCEMGAFWLMSGAVLVSRSLKSKKHTTAVSEVHL